ncbi:hypothetical protein AVEN_63182-1 [Araneus ventricosus]|uniref:Uncharacterized protein n=1 Tax=Araneus ventricosus TaxID=182803 RepID=A0A4Y2B198_ARAVE|nr:hypothetical protein AVEN_63182-1 [Araneus ventricosus]
MVIGEVDVIATKKREKEKRKRMEDKRIKRKMVKTDADAAHAQSMELFELNTMSSSLYTDTDQRHFLGEDIDIVQCDHSSRGPHIASCTQHSPCPFSPDLTPCEFPCGVIRSPSGGVPTLMMLMDTISRGVLSIPRDMLRLASDNAVQRMQCVVHEKVVTLKKVYALHEEVPLLNKVLWCTDISSL